MNVNKKSIEIIALTANDYDWRTCILYSAEELPDKNELNNMQKIAYSTAKSKVESNVRIAPNPSEVLEELVILLEEQGIKPLEVLSYNVANTTVRTITSL